ncbi:MAG TPA: hypothetical protein PLI19_02960 [Erysipelotrichaceae bacterium]|nr:hypothetical protein [Erysipelotrichaceae bacterium]
MEKILNMLVSNPVILIVISLVGLALLLFSAKRKEDIDMPGKHHRSYNPKAPKDISSSELTYFSMHIIGESETVSGNVEIVLDAYTDKDEYLLKKAKDRIAEFEKLGYMLWLTVANDLSEDYVRFEAAVDKAFVREFAQQIRKSGVMKLNGTYDWVDGLPENAGHFTLAARYQTKEKIGLSINAYIPNQAVRLFEHLKPLLISKMRENNANYIPLLNYNKIIANPKRLIRLISISQSHPRPLNTFNFNLEIEDDRAYLSGDFTDYDGSHSCKSVEIDPADLEIIITAFLSNKYVFVPDSFQKEDNIAILEDCTFSYYVFFQGISEGYRPYYGTFDESAQDMIDIFKQAVKKYRH